VKNKSFVFTDKTGKYIMVATQIEDTLIWECENGKEIFYLVDSFRDNAFLVGEL